MRNFSPFSIRVAMIPLVLALAVGCGSDEEVVSTDGDSGGGNSSGDDSNNAPSAPSAPAAPAGENSAGSDADSMMGNSSDSSMGNQMGDGGEGIDAGDPYGGSTNGPGNQVVSKFPDDFAKWQPDDYRNAARTSDKRCKPAVVQLVNKTPGDAQTAELLTELLALVGKSSNGNSGGDADSYDIPGMSPDMTLGTDDSPACGDDSTTQLETLTPDSCSGDPGGPPMSGYEDLDSSADMQNPGDYSSGNYDGTGGQNGGNAQELVHAIIDGLAKNNSNQAWQALTQVLAGEIKTVVDERQMAEWVLAAALDGYGGADHPTHAMLDAALRNPERLNKARGAELQAQTAALILATATSVMDRLMGIPIPNASARRSNGSNQPGSGSVPSSGAYPMPGDGGDGALPMPGGAGEPQMSGEYSGANATMPNGGQFGAPDGPRSPVTRRPLSDEAMRHAIQYLWRAETTSFVEGSTRNIQSLDDGFATLSLAGSLPTTGVRKATFDLLFSRWQDGAGPLLSRKLFQTVVRDPGMIVVLKQLPRLMKQGTLKNQQSATANPRASKSQRQSIAKHSWMETSAYMVRAVTNRLQKATSQQKNAIAPKLPFRLHRNARVRGVYELNWPADVSEFTTGVTPPGPLSLQYVRMEIPKEDAAKTFEFYKKQLRRGKDYKFSWGGWVDSLTAGTDKSTRRSIDVLITQNSTSNGANQNDGYGGSAGAGAGYSGGANGGGQQQNAGTFTVEILVVEIPDPKPSADTP
jgi:hypothetical protein